MRVERKVCVETADGRKIDALAFTTNPVRASTDGPVSPRFVEALKRGATSAGLPNDWVAKLSSAA
jgi:hypothetical protein